MNFNNYFKLNNIPNILTIFRILFIPLIICFLAIEIKPTVYFIQIDNWTFNTTLNKLLAGIFFLLACITDFLDGYLARKYKWISTFGKIWDPIADKALTTSVYIFLAANSIVLWYCIVLMVCRDVIVDAYRVYSSSKNIVVAANIFGKLKTVFQMISIIVILFLFSNDINNASSLLYYLLQNGFIIIATIISCVSGVIYIFEINKKLKEKSLS